MMKNFDKRFDRMATFINVVFIGTFILIIGSWILIGLMGLKVFKGDISPGEILGKEIKKFDEARKGNVVNDSTYVVDSLNIK